MQLIIRYALIWSLVVTSAFGADPELGQSFRARDRGQCRILFAKTNKETGKVDDTNGIKIANLSLDELKVFLDKREDLDGVVMLTGLPMWGKEKNDFVAGVHKLLKDYDLPDVPVRVFSEPKGTGLNRVAQELRYFYPVRTDLQEPVLSDKRGSFITTGAGNIALAVFSFKTFKTLVALPVVMTNVGLDFAAAFYRRSISNWMNRSSNNQILNAAQNFLKECHIGGLFAFGMWGNQRWAEVWNTLHDVPFYRWPLDFSWGIGHFAVSQFTTIFANAILFTFLFQGLYRWDKLRSGTPEGNEMVRRVSPWIQALFFATITPAMAFATASPAAVVTLPLVGLGLNGGQLAMFGLAGLGTIAWARPQLYDRAVPVVDHVVEPVAEKVIYLPMRYVSALFRRNILGQTVADAELKDAGTIVAADGKKFSVELALQAAQEAPAEPQPLVIPTPSP